MQKLSNTINENNNTGIRAEPYIGDSISLTNDGLIVVNQIGSDTFDAIYKAGYRVDFIGASSSVERLNLFLKKL